MTVAERSVQEIPQQASVFRHILVAVDYSEASRRAIAAALSIAVADAKLSVLHVAHPDWRYEMLENPSMMDLERRDEQERLNAFVRELHTERAISATLIKSGTVAETVVSTILGIEADLLVIGTRGRSGLSKLALGSVAEELLRVAPCPVLTVGPHVRLEAAGKPQTILFATDFGRGSVKAVAPTLELARAHRAKLMLLHMLAPIPVPSTSLSAYAPSTTAADELEEWERASRKRCLRELRDFLPPENGLEREPDYIVGTEFLPEGILMAAEKYNVDLIVMGANHAASPRFAAHMPWSAVHEIVRHSRCPVLTVAG
jgi:nucleotide-binding universal stress UspA family protein